MTHGRFSRRAFFGHAVTAPLAGVGAVRQTLPAKGWIIVALDWEYNDQFMYEGGRTVDVHALRHSFGTLLSKGGVAPRTAQAALRHSEIDLTMQDYTDPKLLDVQGALDALPALPLDAVFE